jgi:ABC-2 type transport system permease protein
LKRFQGVYIIWCRDLLRFWRDRARLFTSFIQPLFFLVIFGTGLSTAALLRGELSVYDYKEFVFPGIIAMIVLFTSIMWGVSIVWDREFGFLKEVLVAPISRTAVALGKTLGGATIATIQGTVMLVFAPLAGVGFTPIQVLLLIVLMFVFALSLTALGIFAASRIRTMEGFQVVMQLLLFPLFFLSPALFSAENLPSWLGIPVRINPVSYGVDSFRQVVLSSSEGSAISGLTLFGHHTSIAEDVALVALFGVVMVGLAVWSFGVQE